AYLLENRTHSMVISIFDMGRESAYRYSAPRPKFVGGGSRNGVLDPFQRIPAPFFPLDGFYRMNSLVASSAELLALQLQSKRRATALTAIRIHNRVCRLETSSGPVRVSYSVSRNLSQASSSQP